LAGIFKFSSINVRIDIERFEIYIDKGNAMNDYNDLKFILSKMNLLLEGEDVPKPLELHLLGGAACVLGGHIERATIDFDFIDTSVPAIYGRILNILRYFHIVEWYYLPVSYSYTERMEYIFQSEFKNIKIGVLSKEDLIISKLGRFNERDIEDINKLIKNADKVLISVIYNEVIKRRDLEEKVKAVLF
jgi:hypothetical protein